MKNPPLAGFLLGILASHALKHKHWCGVWGNYSEFTAWRLYCENEKPTLSGLCHMANLRSQVIQEWWPTTQALDLVEGSCDVVAASIHAEVSRFVDGEVLTSSSEVFQSLHAAFSSASDFANVPTFFLVLPTHSRWSVLWNNYFLCDGYDSLCHCLTLNHGLTTLHWSAHDEGTTMQSGTGFSYRYMKDGLMLERVVQAAQQDSRWEFVESGQPIAEEDLESYKARRKRDRLNEERMSQLLARLGASPWSESFYDLSKPCSIIQRDIASPFIVRRHRDEILMHG